MERNRNIDFELDVQTDSLKDAFWRLTTRVYLLEDFIAERFGEVLGPSGYKKVASESEVPPPAPSPSVAVVSNVITTSKISSNDENSNVSTKTNAGSTRRGRKRRKRGRAVSADEEEHLNVQKMSKSDTIEADPLIIRRPHNSEYSEDESLLTFKNEASDQDFDDSDGDYVFLKDEIESEKRLNENNSTENVEKDPDYHDSGAIDQPPDKVLQFVQSIRRQQQIMKIKLDALSKIMPTLLEKVEKPDDTAIQSTPFSLPMETVPEFWRLSNFFLANQTEKEKLIVMLGAIGGNNGNQTTYRVMAALMTDDLTVQFTAKGRTGKENFSGSVFLSCVCAAVRRNPKAHTMTDKEIEDRIDYFLRKAGTRLKKVQSLS